MRASRKLGTKILAIWLVLLVTFQGFYTPTSLAIEDGVSPETEVLEQEEELEVNLGDKRSVEVEIEEPETVEEVEEYIAEQHLPKEESNDVVVKELPLEDEAPVKQETDEGETSDEPVEEEDKKENSEKQVEVDKEIEKIVEERSTRTSPEDPTVVDGAKLTLGEDGIVYYDGRPLLISGTMEQISEELSNLMIEGVQTEALPVTEAILQSLPPETQKALSRAITSPISRPLAIAPTTEMVTSTSTMSVIPLQTKTIETKVLSATSTATALRTMSTPPKIRNMGVVSFGGSWGDYFEVDGNIAFCIVRYKPSPSTGMPYHDPVAYNSDEIRRVMYYGWGGPANIFTNKNEGIITTSEVLSELYSGQPSLGRDLPKFNQLLNLAKTGHVPSYEVSFSKTNLKVNVKSGKQVTESTTFRTDKLNTTTIRVPKDVTLVNETTGKKVTNGSMVIKGGETIHLEAPLNKTLSYKTGNLQGSQLSFQPFITKPHNDAYQTLGYFELFRDPSNVASFSANFVNRSVTVTIERVDRQTNEVIKKTSERVDIGKRYNYCPEPTINYKGKQRIRENSTCASGTVPNKNFTVKLYYTTEWDLTIEYYDKNNGKLLQKVNGGKYRVGQNYSRTAPSTLINSGTNYKITVSTSIKGKMPRSNHTVRVPYDPYKNVTVVWKNMFPNHDVFKQSDQTLKVGSKYNFTQPESFTKNGLIYDRINNSSFTGTLGYADEKHEFLYKLRRTVTVKYLDERTGQELKSTKEYKVYQGDKYEETPASITNGAQVYEHVRTVGVESGTINTDNINITYYYQVPLAQVELKKIQIYTAKSTEGLPVKVEIDKVMNYTTGNDIKDPNKTITVQLEDSGVVLDSKKYTAQDLPRTIEFKIPADKLEKNNYKMYTVRLTEFDDVDFKVPATRDSLATEGYTSNEGKLTYEVGVGNNTFVSKYVVMTEKTPITPMKKYFETLTAEVTPIEDQKSGYGVKTDVTFKYENELGVDSDYATSIPTSEFTISVPTVLKERFLDYTVEGDNFLVPLDKDESTNRGEDLLAIDSKFQFPHMNVERQTGHIFTDEQVAIGNPNIKHDIRDGGNKLYTPIWAEIGDYEVKYTSEEIGANKISYELKDVFNIYAQMMLTLDSETMDKDEIVFMPINAENPFANGKPDNWTDEDVEWLKY